MVDRYKCLDCGGHVPSVSKRGLCIECSIPLLAEAVRASLKVYSKYPKLLAKELKELEL